MFGWFEIKSPLTVEQRTWIENRFNWLRQEFGDDLLRRPVATPSPEFFPDRYTATESDVEVLLGRLCSFMQLNRARLELKFYTSSAADDVATAFNVSLRREYALGAYEDDGQKILIWLEKSRLSEPSSVISTLVHELGHVHLLGNKHCDVTTPDHEPLTDLLAVYFGFGIFMANNAVRETTWRWANYEGWSAAKQGYLTIPEYAYALALYAHAQGDTKPTWVSYLRSDVRALFNMEFKHVLAGTIPPSSHIPKPDPSQVDDSDTVGPPHSSTAMETGSDTHLHGEDLESDADTPVEVEFDPESEELEHDTNLSADEYFTQGAVYASQGEFKLAIESYSRAIALNPDDSEAWLSRARVHLTVEHFDQAVADSSKSLRLDPDEVTGYVCRAEACLWLRRYSEALQDLNQAMKFEKRDPQIYYLRGIAHLCLAKNSQAVTDLNSAIRFAPTWSENYLARSRAYDALGKSHQSQADLAEAIRRNPQMRDPENRLECLAGRPVS